MKGISPIVATVLLIAVTMTIAGVLAYWSSTFVSQRLPDVNSTSSACDLAQFEFLACQYNSTSQNITFSVNNVKTISLSNLTAYVQYSNGTVSSPINLNSTLDSGAIKSFTVSASSDFSSLVVKTNCPQLSRTSSCGR